MGSTDSIINMNSFNIAIEDSIINPNFSEEKWVRKMKRLLNKETCQEIDQNSISIFNVPKSVKSIKPEAYTPQIIPLGPYHSFHPNLFKSQRFKLYQAQILHQEFNLLEFEILSEQIGRKVVDVQSYYNEHLEISNQTLSWIMVIDGLFLLRLIYREGSETELFDESGRKFPTDSILRDAIMIENQIPFFVLEHLVASSPPISRITPLIVMAIKICPRISPITLEGKFFRGDFEYPFHILDLLYNLVLLGGILQSVDAGLRHSSGPISKLLGMIQISFPASEEEEKGLIPNASQLSGLKVKFFGGVGIKNIGFKQVEGTLQLPILTLNFHSDAVIRNLMAYEAIAKPESPDFTRYIEMMEAMIRTVEDVEVLRSEGIMKHEGDSSEVVKLFQGFRRDITLCQGKSELLNEVIKGINEYYDSNWRTKLKKMLKKYVYSSWKMFTVVATLWLLLLTTLQTFCSLYSCPDFFKTSRKDLSFTSLASPF